MCERCPVVAHVLTLVNLSILLFLFGIGSSAYASTCNEYADICGFVEHLKTKAGSIVLESEDVRAKLETEVDRVLDFDEISKFVMGKHWKLATNEKKSEFTSAYSRYIRDIYVTQLQRYATHRMRIMSVKKLGDTATYTVRVRLSQAGRSDDYVVLEFYVERGDVLKISDIRVNNSISILVNQRVVVNDIIKELGIEGTIAHFNKK